MPARLTSHDSNLARDFGLRFENGGKLNFQFPPKVASDGRKGNWQEEELRGREPIAIFSTSGPREITLTATYIVDGSSGLGVDKIHQQIILARGYFARVRELATTRNLVCHLKMWHIGGKNEMTCRITNVGVKYGDTLVGSGSEAFPLRTDLTLDLRMWTQGSCKDPVQKVQNLKNCETADWY